MLLKMKSCSRSCTVYLFRIVIFPKVEKEVKLPTKKHLINLNTKVIVYSWLCAGVLRKEKKYELLFFCIKYVCNFIGCVQLQGTELNWCCYHSPPSHNPCTPLLLQRVNPWITNHIFFKVWQCLLLKLIFLLLKYLTYLLMKAVCWVICQRAGMV